MSAARLAEIAARIHGLREDVYMLERASFDCASEETIALAAIARSRLDAELLAYFQLSERMRGAEGQRLSPTLS